MKYTVITKSAATEYGIDWQNTHHIGIGHDFIIVNENEVKGVPGDFDFKTLEEIKTIINNNNK